MASGENIHKSVRRNRSQIPESRFRLLLGLFEFVQSVPASESAFPRRSNCLNAHQVCDFRHRESSPSMQPITSRKLWERFRSRVFASHFGGSGNGGSGRVILATLPLISEANNWGHPIPLPRFTLIAFDFRSYRNSPRRRLGPRNASFAKVGDSAPGSGLSAIQRVLNRGAPRFCGAMIR